MQKYYNNATFIHTTFVNGYFASRWCGESLKDWIEKYFDWVAWGFLAVLGLGFVALKFL